MRRSSDLDSGVLVIAYGKKKYIDMAINLAMSYHLYNSNTTIAIVTDDLNNDKLKELYNIIIPINLNYGHGLVQKLYMLDYSPFKKTLFIDSDCLIIRNLDFLFDALNGRNIAVTGNAITEGTWLGVEVESFIRKHNLPFIIPFNGGMYYFENSKDTTDIFNCAKEHWQRYEDLGFSVHASGKNEEPIMSFAISKFAEKPFSDVEKKSMYTPIGIKGSIRIDVLRGFCSFKKYSERVEPSIVHFPGSFSESFFYTREVFKLKFHYKNMLPKKMISMLINFFFNSFYAAYIVLFRLYSTMNGKSCRYTPLLPALKKLA